MLTNLLLTLLDLEVVGSTVTDVVVQLEVSQRGRELVVVDMR